MENEKQKCTSTPTTNRGVENANDVEKTLMKSNEFDKKIGLEENTDFNNKIDTIIDWFQCTIKMPEWDDIKDETTAMLVLREEVYNLLQYFGYEPDECIYLPTGVSGYNNTYVIQTKIKVMVNYSMANMGIMIMLSGYACRELEQYYSWKFLFGFINNYVVNINRIDIAHDFFNFRYDIMKKIHNHINKKALTSKYKTTTIIKEKYISSDNLKGDSIRFGDRSSLVTTIFYDKKLERKQADYLVSDKIFSWVRCETSYRQERGNELYQRIINNVDDATLFESQVLYNYIDFKDLKAENKQKCRCKTAKWWNELIGDIGKQTLSKKAIQNSLQKKNTWISSQVCKTLAMLQVADSYHSIAGSNDSHDITYKSTWITDMVSRGMDKIDKNDLAYINTYLKDNGVNVVLTKDDLKNFMVRLLKN